MLEVRFQSDLPHSALRIESYDEQLLLQHAFFLRKTSLRNESVPIHKSL